MSENLSSYKAGLLTGLGIMFALGFFILLGVVLKDKLPNNNTANTNNNNNVVANGNTNNNPSAPAYDFVALAKAAGADEDDFNKCLSDKKYASKISTQSTEAQTAGGKGTPYSIIMSGDIRVPINGAQPLTVIKEALDAIINNDSAKLAALNQPTLNLPAVNKDSDHIKGNKDAKITIVEYSDMECPYCQRFHPTMQQVIADYGDKVNWVYRHFPLTSIHPNAMNLALSSECVAELEGNDKFWEFVDSTVQL